MKRPGSLSVSRSIHKTLLIKMLLVNTEQGILTDEMCD